MKQHLLLVTNGSPESKGAIEYGIWLAGFLNKDISLLGIVDDSRSQQAVKAIFAQVRESLSGNTLIRREDLIKGDPAQAIGQIARAPEHLVVVGPMGRPGWLRWLRGRSFRYLLKEVDAPLIYVQEARPGLKRILVCMGGLGYASSVEHWALYLASCCGAFVTVLHVTEPIYYDYPTTQQVRAYGDGIIDSETPQGRNLRRALQDADAMGVPVELKIRHGDIIHEISAEIAEHDYDLVAMGSPESSHSLRHLFMQNITAQIAEHGPLPVLTARLGQEPILETVQA